MVNKMIGVIFITLLIGMGTVAMTKKDNTVNGTLDTLIELKHGTTLNLDGDQIKFIAVTEDSRCPNGTHCMWAGVAKIQLALGDDIVEISVPGLTDSCEVKVDLGSYEVLCTGLTPYPQSGSTIDKERYVAKLTFTKK